jgi:hypothetical protein
MFVLGGSGDHDSGGFALSELVRNLSICVSEKSRRIARHKSRYDEWWLVASDHIGYDAIEADDIEALRAHRASWDDFSWHRIVLVSPVDPLRWVEL